MSQSKVLQDIDGLIDLFLSPDFDPLSKGDSATNLQEFSFESEISDDSDELGFTSYQVGNNTTCIGQSIPPPPPPSKPIELVPCGPQSVPTPPPPHFRHDEFFTKKCGRVFAKLGDEYIGVQQRDISSELQRAVQPLENNSENAEVLKSSWESFKHVPHQGAALGTSRGLTAAPEPLLEWLYGNSFGLMDVIQATYLI